MQHLRLLAFRLLPLLAAAALSSGGAALAQPAAPDSAFARTVARLSEPGGYFDTDNLVSNESSYLHVLGALRAEGLRGGAYIGVGPDQSFSYIVHLRPRIAFLVDIRRDNLLQHLLFKSLFSLARNRLEYLALLFGRPLPADPAAWDERPLPELLDLIDRAPASPESRAAAARRVSEAAARAGLPLSEADRATIRRIHEAFLAEGPAIRFTSHGRGPQSYYPTYRQLLLETDLSGRPGSFLAREEDFRFLKDLQARDLVVPVVGDLAGPHALAEIGRLLAERGERVTLFYASNVEFYLMREGSFDRFVENLGRLPLDPAGLIVRSYFNRFRQMHPQSQPGHGSTQLAQRLPGLLEQHARQPYRSYYELVTRDVLPAR